MTVGKGKAIIVAVVLLHTLLLAAYTFPEELVPERMRIIGQWYARPVFHQRWKLFAPDPPQCSCALQLSYDTLSWQPVASSSAHYLEQRIVQNHCLWLSEDYPGMEEQAHLALLRLADDATTATRFRLVEECITDPALPAERSTRIKPLFGP